jgi:hypothetical protein
MQQTLKNESKSVDDISEDLAGEERGARDKGSADEEGNNDSIKKSSFLAILQ